MSATTHQPNTASTESGPFAPNPGETHQEASGAAARLVPENEREKFTPRLFGARMFMHGETAVFTWMRRLCKAYTGGYWEFYTVGDEGAGFMVPRMDAPVTLYVETNGYEGQMTAEAAGIVVTLFALNHLMFQTPSKGAVDVLADRYEELREFAAEHPEMSAIFGAID